MRDIQDDINDNDEDMVNTSYGFTDGDEESSEGMEQEE